MSARQKNASVVIDRNIHVLGRWRSATEQATVYGGDDDNLVKVKKAI